MGKKQKDTSEMSTAELQNLVNQLEGEIFQLRNELALQRKLEKPHLLIEKRRERARALTFMTQNRRKTQ